MSLSEEGEKNVRNQEKLLKGYFTKALDTTNNLESLMQNMMFAMFHQTQILLILIAEIDDKLDEIEQISKSVYTIEEQTKE